MAVVNGCNIPEDLLYDVDPEANAFTWAKDNGDGTFTIGLTSIAAAMAGKAGCLHSQKARQNSGKA
jgi:glycine cleavage system H protein